MDEFSFRSMVSAVLSKPSFHRTLIILLFVYYSIVYYFGEIIDLAGWDSLRWDFFYSIHDIHRLFFLVPVIYTGYIFRARWALLVTFASFLVFLPRAVFFSPYSDPALRMVLFILISGIVGTLTAMFRNETERRTGLERMIKAERDRFRDILERMEDGVVIIGPDYRIRFTNSSIVRDFGEGIGKNCYEYLHKLEKPCDDFCKIESIGTWEAERREYTFPQGTTYDVIASPFTDNDGVTCQLATFRNITRRKMIENELRELNNLKNDLLSNVSHELRSPLTSIKGTVSSLLQKDIELDSETRDMLLDGISEETDRLISLVTNLLNMSRLEAGVWAPVKERCYLQDIITEVMEKQKWVKKNYTFRSQIENDLPAVNADSSQIRQVLINLLENATAYSEEGTTISVSAKTAAGKIQVSVSDEGAGIPPEDIERVFDKFFRGSQSRTMPGGTGLGLAICRAIINGHGGRIWAESKTGQGSTFYFTLPSYASSVGKR